MTPELGSGTCCRRLRSGAEGCHAAQPRSLDTVTSHSRHFVLAAIAGVAVAVISLLGGVWLARALGGGATIDGEFVLDQPGIFEQPFDDVNADVAGDRLPEVDLLDRDGKSVRLADYGGRPLVVNFWFSRCVPCRRELRDFAAVHSELGERVQFVGVDPFDTLDAMERFAHDRGVSYDLLRDDGSLSNQLGIVGYPVTLFVDAEGRVLRQVGEIDAETLRSLIEELL